MVSAITAFSGVFYDVLAEEVGLFGFLNIARSASKRLHRIGTLPDGVILGRGRNDPFRCKRGCQPGLKVQWSLPGRR